MGVDWSETINFTSALLLHSCITILIKETLNVVNIFYRLFARLWLRYYCKTQLNGSYYTVVIDGYTSIFSKDTEGEQSELYFTNTGIVLLAVSLASSVAMNVKLDDRFLDILVASTFGLCFVSSLLVGKAHYTLPIMALRRAGRFIWSDTPFVNFFSLIYVAAVLHGQSELRLQDYITLRGVAILELVFMKAKLASCNPKDQEKLMRRLIETEWIPWGFTKPEAVEISQAPFVKRDDIVAFRTLQRLGVMLVKTSIGYVNGCLRGPLGPCRCLLPAKGQWVEQPEASLQIYRINKRTIILVDRFDKERPKNVWQKFIKHAHGVLLRRLGKIRVVYAVLDAEDDGDQQIDENATVLRFHSNINVVTGVSKSWLATFKEGKPVGECLIALGKG